MGRVNDEVRWKLKVCESPPLSYFVWSESLYSGNKAVNDLYGTESELLGGLASCNRLMRTDNSLAVSIVGFGLKTLMVYLSNYDSCLKTPNSEQPIAIEKESMRSV